MLQVLFRVDAAVPLMGSIVITEFDGKDLLIAHLIIKYRVSINLKPANLKDMH